MNIFDSIQKQVDKICKEKYKNDQSPPTFIVSLLYENGDREKDKTHQIALTIIHIGHTFTKVIFPDVNQKYGYENLEETMIYMYNKTM